MFSVALILLGLAIIFFHYVQGFFSATLSAIAALIAAALALGYHESLVEVMKPTKFADQADAILIAAIFGVTYIVLRLAFDWIVPGNVRMQSTVDKVGAAAVGVLAAIFCTGILAIAIQTLPLGPTILGFSRYKMVEEQSVSISGRGDFWLTDATRQNTFNTDQEGNRQSLGVPVDQMTLSLVGSMSDGALQSRQTMGSVHPDYLQELFAGQLGIESGARHSAWDYPNDSQVTFDNPMWVDSLRQVDDTPAALRKVTETPAFPPSIKADADHVILLIGCSFSANAADPDTDLIRMSTGAARLVVGHPEQSGETTYKDVYPLGTVNLDSNTLYAVRPDDPILVKISKEGPAGAWLAFLVDKKDLTADATAKPLKIRDGTFVEIKRLARCDLSGATLGTAESSKRTVLDTVEHRQIAAKPPVHVSEPPRVGVANGALDIKAIAKEQANRLAQAMMAGDYNTVASLTNPKIVELLGGREGFIKKMQEGMRDWKAKGTAFESVVVGDVQTVREVGRRDALASEHFAIVPETMHITVSNGKLIQDSFLLGDSTDGGKQWTFVDGSSLSSAVSVKSILPNFPADMQLPKPTPPVFVGSGSEPASVPTKAPEPGAGTGTGTGTGAEKVPLRIMRAEAFSQLPMKVNSGDPVRGRLDGNVSASMDHQQFDSLTVHTSEPMSAINVDAKLINELYVPPGKKMVQITASPVGDAWDWAGKLGNFMLVDSKANSYPMAGAWGYAQQAGGGVRFFAQYSAQKPLTKIEPEKGATPSDLWVVFLVPGDAQIKELQYKGLSCGAIAVP